jgi:hypothetical protein
MPGSDRNVVLTEEQIAFIKASFDYSLKRIREVPIDPSEDRGAALARRRGQEDIAASTKAALRDAS